MKSKLFFSILIVLFSNVVVAQPGNPAQQLAHLQAKRMKDSVGINNVKKEKIYQVNMDIFYKKQRVRYLYASQPVVMKKRIRRIENTRDSLYHYILRPEAKFQLYLSRRIIF